MNTQLRFLGLSIPREDKYISSHGDFNDLELMAAIRRCGHGPFPQGLSGDDGLPETACGNPVHRSLLF